MPQDWNHCFWLGSSSCDVFIGDCAKTKRLEALLFAGIWIPKPMEDYGRVHKHQGWLPQKRRNDYFDRCILMEICCSFVRPKFLGIEAALPWRSARLLETSDGKGTWRTWSWCRWRIFQTFGEATWNPICWKPYIVLEGNVIFNDACSAGAEQKSVVFWGKCCKGHWHVGLLMEEILHRSTYISWDRFTVKKHANNGDLGHIIWVQRISSLDMPTHSSHEKSYFSTNS